tara:strand:+ start:38 stop:406 length:369 start_codon:yes stop_codon:yes gene_type:complete
MAQIPNKKKVRVSITGTGAANVTAVIPDSGHYTKFTISCPAVTGIGDIEGDMGGGFLPVAFVNTMNAGVTKLALSASHICTFELHTPIPGGLRIVNINHAENAVAHFDIMMSGSLYSSGRNS